MSSSDAVQLDDIILKIADSDPSSKSADTNPYLVALLTMQLLEALNPRVFSFQILV
jgi:hypothetical protein